MEAGGGIVLDENAFEIMETIVRAIRRAGYDPYAQLTGFLRSSDVRYITRTDNARYLIQELDRTFIKQYVKRMQ
jgi:uncharacterized protein (UPF0297 family)